MYTSKDGSNFGNHEMGKRYDESRKAPMTEKAPTMEDEHEEQPIEESMQEHGPVEHIEMHSHHRDGHVHKSKHHDSKSAHEHVSKAMGEEEESQESPEFEAGEQEAAHSIPGMK